MPRAIYVPLFDSFFEGSIMREELPVRFVMLALIRLAWRSGANGEVDIDPLIFAQSINMPSDEVDAAIRRLMEPDPRSASPDEDGRRIVPIHPERPFRGWRLVNWQRYRVMLNRVNDAARKREEYHEAKDTSEVSESLQKSPRVSKSLRLSRNSRYDTIRDDTRRDDTKLDQTKKKEAQSARPDISEISEYAEKMGYPDFNAETFHSFYESKGWVVGKSPMRSWKAAVRSWAGRDARRVPVSSPTHAGMLAHPEGWEPTPEDQVEGVDLELLKKLREAEK
jgi:hypothetical protein